MDARGTAPDGAKVERRRTPRYSINVPLEASWRGHDGTAVKEPAVAKQVNANGGLLEMANYPDVGSRITLTNFLSAETAEARVLATPCSRKGVSYGIIVELIVPGEGFWGVNLQTKKAGVELQKLEESLQAEGIDLRLLNEFRDAVDFVRTAAVIVQQLREGQLRGRDDDNVAELVITERIRRTTNLSLEVITDIESGKVGRDTKGVKELSHALDRACEQLRILLKKRNPSRYITTKT